MANPANQESETSFLTNFLRDVPPVTRVLFLGTLSLTFGSLMGVLPPTLFVLDWRGVVYNFRIWGPFLSAFHAGTAGFNFLLHLYFLYNYSRQLEANTFFGRAAAYAWMLTLCQLVIVLMAPILDFVLAGPALLMAIMHVWGRNAGELNVKLYGVISIPAKYIALAMCAISTVLNGKLDTSDIAGILAGQLYYFFDSVFPGLPQGRRVIFVPLWFERGIDYIGDVGNRALGIGSTNRQMSGGSRPTSNGNGSVSTAPSGSSFGARSTGVTQPAARPARHVWGSGRTLGS